jgi:hypothetical protein
MSRGRTDAGDEVLRAFLRDRTIGCPSCRYNLRGVEGAWCPECGTRLSLHLCAMKARLGSWLLGLLAVALPLGFAATFAVVGAHAAWRRTTWWRDADWRIAGAAWGLTLLYLVILLIIIVRRHRFARLPVLEQRVRAWATVLLMLCLQAATLYLLSRFGGPPLPWR